MDPVEKFNKSQSPMFAIKFPAFNPTEEEVKRLAYLLNYVVKSFNEKNTTPVELDVISHNDICPRTFATFSVEDFK